jgi:ketosteroid isomerase-like protein
LQRGQNKRIWVLAERGVQKWEVVSIAKLTRRRAITSISAASIAATLDHQVHAATNDSETNKNVVRRLFDEAYNNGNLDALDEILSPDFVGEDPDNTAGIPEYKRAQSSLREQYERFFSSFRFEMTDVVAEGSLVFVRLTLTGEQLEIGKQEVSTSGFLEAAFADVRIVQIWSLVDVASLMEQLQ